MLAGEGRTWRDRSIPLWCRFWWTGWHDRCLWWSPQVRAFSAPILKLNANIMYFILVHQGKNWKQCVSLQSRSKHDGETDYSWCCGVEQPLGWDEKSDKVRIQIWHFFKNHHVPFAVRTNGQKKRISGEWADVGGIPFSSPAPAYSWFR